ncbi:hypothetical protein GUITHDRAFT_118041 [Guillardia theta CCMP2712]|uniref:Uncharacterized protein n=1 Tax=Guillardia theta (strain CCMP2712) TaxID=905079 RepID=L1IHQ8_GUITC|nr:hypothetical protein GUITHDRAFT_118041 [Guillardia theta CCMP2712]EKX35766.1 hypothetical protein GUITHDRAFT_118041 [Guillardia theta CCMP2712]|eukprot:XP_005822746.1 hypothetical protein GUITHDRAFT_118041 [Guillardia theta CCMP2712]
MGIMGIARGSLCFSTIRKGWQGDSNDGGIATTQCEYDAASNLAKSSSGLPLHSEIVPPLPPKFRGVDEKTLQIAIETCFPTLPKHMAGILEHCLASIVYHFNYLSLRLDPCHPFWSSALFLERGLLEKLKEKAFLPQTPEVPRVNNVCAQSQAPPPPVEVPCDDPSNRNSLDNVPKDAALVPEPELSVQLKSLEKKIDEQRVELKRMYRLGIDEVMKELNTMHEQYMQKMQSMQQQMKQMDQQVSCLFNQINTTLENREGQAVNPEEQEQLQRQRQNVGFQHLFQQQQEMQRMFLENNQQHWQIQKQILQKLQQKGQQGKGKGRGHEQGGSAGLSVEPSELSAPSQDSEESQDESSVNVRSEPMKVSDEAGVMMNAWTLWHCGNHHKSLPPMKNWKAAQLSSRAESRRLSDMRYLMKNFHQFIKRSILDSPLHEFTKSLELDQLKAFIDGAPSLQEANALFKKHSDRFLSWTERGEANESYSERSGQLSWITYVKKLRVKEKTSPQEMEWLWKSEG